MNSPKYLKILQKLYSDWDFVEPENSVGFGYRGCIKNLGDIVELDIAGQTDEMILLDDGEEIPMWETPEWIPIKIEHSLQITNKNSNILFKTLKEKHPFPWKAFAADIVLLKKESPDGKSYEIPTLIYGIKPE